MMNFKVGQLSCLYGQRTEVDKLTLHRIWTDLQSNHKHVVLRAGVPYEFLHAGEQYSIALNHSGTTEGLTAFVRRCLGVLVAYVIILIAVPGVSV